MFNNTHQFHKKKYMYLTHVLSLGVLKIYVLFLYVKHVKTF